MGILNIDHPDIEAFVVSKKKESVLRNFNISVGVTDQFMQALENNAEWDLVHPNSKKTVKRISAKKIWDDIVEAAWQTGDPGLVFLDTINRFNPTPALGAIEATNPCGEVPLLAYESCNLGSVNLSKCVKNKNDHPEVDWRLLEEVIQIAIRFLDNVIEVNNYLIPEIKEMAMGNRKTGLGVMGWADMLALLELPYASENAIKLGEQLMQFIAHTSREASEALAAERGAFPNWEKSIYYPGRPIRNATRTSIAPTGSISIIANTSSSIEPLFAHAFKRMHVLDNETINSVNSILINYLRSHQLYSEKIYRQILHEGVAAQVSELPDAVKDIFKTALEIPPVWHLQHQLVFQQYTDNAVSKTINLPETALLKDVDEIYRTAWRFGAKGITVFRNHSTGTQVMHAGLDQQEKICQVCKE
jgi:ribonucleoside-diphosphate reductase alpha chain